MAEGGSDPRRLSQSTDCPPPMNVTTPASVHSSRHSRASRSSLGETERLKLQAEIKKLNIDADELNIRRKLVDLRLKLDTSIIEDDAHDDKRSNYSASDRTSEWLGSLDLDKLHDEDVDYEREDNENAMGRTTTGPLLMDLSCEKLEETLRKLAPRERRPPPPMKLPTPSFRPTRNNVDCYKRTEGVSTSQVNTNIVDPTSTPLNGGARLPDVSQIFTPRKNPPTVQRIRRDPLKAETDNVVHGRYQSDQDRQGISHEFGQRQETGRNDSSRSHKQEHFRQQIHCRDGRDTLGDCTRRSPSRGALSDVSFPATIDIPRQSSEKRSWIDRAVEKSNSFARNHSPPSHSRQHYSAFTPPGPISGFMPMPALQMDVLTASESERVYDGNFMRWFDWSLTFKSTIHDNIYLSDSQKLTALRNMLGEEPRSHVYGLLWSENTYLDALFELQRIYGDRFKIGEAYSRWIRSFQPLKTYHDVAKYETAVKKLIQIYRALHFDADLGSQALLGELASKLTDSMRRAWGKHVARHGNPSVEKFGSFLAQETEALRYGGILDASRLNPSSASSNHLFCENLIQGEKDAPPPHSGSRPHPPEGAKGFSGPDPKGRIFCAFCNTNDHYVDKCTSFLQKSDQQRLQWFRTEGRCYRCARKGHRSADCKSRVTCEECRKRHNSSLHSVFVKSTNAMLIDSPMRCDGTTAPDQIDNVDPTNPLVTFQQAVATTSRTYLKIVGCRIYTPDGTHEDCHALIDDGSQACLIEETLARRLNLKGPRRELTLKNCARDVERIQSKRVKFTLGSALDSSAPPIEVHEAWTIPKLELPGHVIPRDSSGAPIWPHANDLHLPDVQPAQIKLLIGANCKQAFHQVQTRWGPLGQPDVILTPFGWTPFGDADDAPGDDAHSPAVLQIADTTDEERELVALVRKFWSTEDFGCRYQDASPLSTEDRKSFALLENKTVLRSDGHYEVPMLWRDDQPQLGNNLRGQALPRWRSLAKRLKREPDLATQYIAAIKKYLDKGYGRELTPDEVEATSPITHYMVHFAVFHPQKRKARVVFDNALKFNGASLNDCLMTGPQLMNSLPGILMRFRIGSVVVTADCSDMFCCVFTPESDADALRFVFNENLDDPPRTFKMLTHVFGSACSPTCAMYALRRSALDNRTKFDPSSVHAILSDTYVDDFLHSTDSEASAIHLAKDVTEIAKAGGFNLTKWVSNSSAVLKAVTSEFDVVADVNLDLDEQPSTRTLGVCWKVRDDQFHFSIKVVGSADQFTKRKVLIIVNSIFDPLGFLSPYIIRARMLFQKLWEAKLEWDDSLTTDLLQEWQMWLSEFPHLDKFRVDRQFWPSDASPTILSLHVFGDSSERAFAACCYIRATTSCGVVHCSLVAARARVAPVGKHTLTLPRLELQAAVLATRLASDVTSELQKRLTLTETTFWTDSVTVLRYISNESTRFKTFVANRVAEVRSVTNPSQWRHCPSEQNPADLATRGRPADQLLASIWLTGPGFLTGPETQWPPRLPTSVVTSCDPEAKSGITAQVSAISAKTSEVELHPRPEDFSTWGRLTSITARIRRYMFNLRNKSKPKFDRFLAEAELHQARNLWMRRAQADTYSPELSAARVKRPISTASPLLKLRPFLCTRSGLLRVGGRLASANIPSLAKHQIILPPKHQVSLLIVRDCHERLLHAGVEHVVSQIRQAFWIPHLRPLVKRVIHECPTCIRHFSQPQVPRMADLPPARLGSEKSIWQHTGVDVFGPFLVTQRRSLVKRWIIIYVSLPIKAVHFELLYSLSTDSMLCSFVRFFYRRGKSVEHLYSDSGSNFIGADRTLREVIKNLDTDESFRKGLKAEGVQWHFNVPKAAHMGGAWEIQIKAAKRSLRVILKDRSEHEEVLVTALSQVEFMMNSRPLSYTGDDPEFPQPLTANHFLNVSSKFDDLSVIDALNPDISSRRRWKRALGLSQELWKRWRREILPSMTAAQKWHKEKRAMSVGDVVLIVDTKAPRGLWPLGRVVKVNPGRDGRVRSAEIKTAAGRLVRPASQICLLEPNKLQ